MLRTPLAGVLTRTWFLLFSLCTMSALVPVALVVVVTVTKTASVVVVVVVVVLVVVRVVVPAAAAATAHEETKHTLTETTRTLQSHKLTGRWSQHKAALAINAAFRLLPEQAHCEGSDMANVTMWPEPIPTERSVSESQFGSAEPEAQLGTGLEVEKDKRRDPVRRMKAPAPNRPLLQLT